MSQFAKGQIGAQVIAETGKDLTTATELKMYWTPPDGTAVKTMVATIVGSTGGEHLQYTTTLATELHTDGWWQVMVRAKFADGRDWPSEINTFYVAPVLY